MAVALAMAVMEVAQAMSVTANVQPTLNHGVRTPGHLAMEEETKEETKEDTADFHQAVDPMAVAQALAPAVATQAMAVMEVAQAMAVMAVALAMAVMAVALALAVTANVQPTLNHGVRTAGHPAMEETLAANVEDQATEETLAPTAEDHQATEETPMATVNPLAMEAMALALAMPTMEEALALAVTANVQPTLNHGVRTAGHPAMEETLAANV